MGLNHLAIAVLLAIVSVNTHPVKEGTNQQFAAGKTHHNPPAGQGRFSKTVFRAGEWRNSAISNEQARSFPSKDDNNVIIILNSGNTASTGPISTVPPTSAPTSAPVTSAPTTSPTTSGPVTTLAPATSASTAPVTTVAPGSSTAPATSTTTTATTTTTTTTTSAPTAGR